MVTVFVCFVIIIDVLSYIIFDVETVIFRVNEFLLLLHMYMSFSVVCCAISENKTEDKTRSIAFLFFFKNEIVPFLQ